MARDAEEIVALLDQRSSNGRTRQHLMNQLATMYLGRMTVPLPELNKEEQPAVANLMYQSAEQRAMRIADQNPRTITFALGELPIHAKNARRRKQSFNQKHLANGLARKQRIRARHLSVYSVAPVILMPDWKHPGNRRGLDDAKWLVIDPRGFYPCIDASDPSDPVKSDAIVHTIRKLGWLRRQFPDTASAISNHNQSDDTNVDWVMYVDHEQITTIASRVLAPGERQGSSHNIGMQRRTVGVNTMQNLTGEPLCITPGGLSLTSEPIGRFDQIIGMYLRMAKLDALSLVALQKSIFSEAWAISNPGEQARIIQAAQPMQGIPGIVEGGSIQFRQMDAALTGRIGVVDMERAIRQTSMTPAEFGGELPTNARTAKQGGRLLSNIIDFDIAEAQELFAESRQHENRLAATIDKRWWGGFTKTIEAETGEQVVQFDYDPAELWTTTYNRVSYALAGADSEGSVIGAGQRQGMGTLSRESFMEVDPMVRDVDTEMRRIDRERMGDAFMSRIQSEAALPEGQSPLTLEDLSRLDELMEEGHGKIESYRKMQSEAQARQNEALPASDPLTNPGVAPGSEVPTEVPASIAGPNEAQSNVTSLLGRLRLAQQTVPGEIPA